MNRRLKNPILLIIDDEKMICEILTEIVQGLTKRIDVISATSVEQAAKLIPKADMIISDIQMPNQHFLDQILNKVMSEKPVARMSGVTHGRINFMIQKPFKTQQVAETLQYLYSFLRETKNGKQKAA